MITTWTSLLITGLRGNGKTLMAVALMDQFIKSGVPVFASNFTDLTLPGVQLLDDPREWQTLPAGAVLFVDEAQRFWRARRSGDPPPEVIAMETQRHDAVRMVMLTQQPTYLDKHVRGLFDCHIHLIRRAGLPMSQQYQWERCKEEPENPATVELADKSVFTFPKEYFGTYRSAEEHHIKRKLPARLKWMVAGVLGALVMGWWAVDSLRADPLPAESSEASAGVSSEADTTAAPSVRRRPLTPAEWAERFIPRNPAIPMSAPAYDDREVVAQPRIACMVGERLGCKCKTEQGTDWHIPDAVCRDLVTSGGVYDPFREPERDDRRGIGAGADGGGSAPTVNALPAEPVAGTREVQQQARYGAFRG